MKIKQLSKYLEIRQHCDLKSYHGQFNLKSEIIRAAFKNDIELYLKFCLLNDIDTVFEFMQYLDFQLKNSSFEHLQYSGMELKKAIQELTFLTNDFCQENKLNNDHFVY